MLSKMESNKKKRENCKEEDENEVCTWQLYGYIHLVEALRSFQKTILTEKQKANREFLNECTATTLPPHLTVEMFCPENALRSIKTVVLYN